MQVKILGSAAGGAFPQWNCACPNCRALRAGTFSGKARSQTQVAISADSRTWFLLGASPDLRTQIEATKDLLPGDTGQIRQSPIAGVVLANADVDHVLGLLLLRELQPLRVYSTKAVHRIISEGNSMFAMLQRAPGQLTWTEFAITENFSLTTPTGEDSGIQCRALSLGRHYPAYVSQSAQAQLVDRQASLGFIFDAPSGKRLAYLPAVPRIDHDIKQELERSDVILFDGTFWSNDELIRIQGSGATALEMGHVPVSSAGGSMAQLAQLAQPRKIYLHINNTNPMLNEAGPEFRAVRDAGWEIAEDGWQFEL